MIYLDNAATSFPKPEGVALAMNRFMTSVGANPGRSGHRLSLEAARAIFDAREKVADLFGAGGPLRVIFCLNATEALNLAIRGLLRPGDHVIASSMEHNSVMRPLRRLEAEGVELSIARCSSEGILDPSDVRKLVRGNTAMIVITHASNVTGSILPVAEIGRLARENGILSLVDAAQTGGCYPIDIETDCIDLLAFSGHKGLFGPQGTGGLVAGARVDTNSLAPLKTGGTGSRSEYETQPDFLPDKYESGTPNTVGIAGLGAGLEFVLGEGIGRIREHEKALTKRLLSGLADIPAITVYGERNPERQTATVSFNIRGIDSSEAAMRLDEEYEIMCRPGLHCSPAAHRTIGAFPGGTIRFSMSYMNSREEIDCAVHAVADIAGGAGGAGK
jgi:cysteine desulfurase / selenocysteine lyase